MSTIFARSGSFAAAVVAAVGAVVSPVHAASGPLAPAAATSSPSPAATSSTFATLLFSRTEITAADNCVVNNAGIARLDSVVAPYLHLLGMSATGTLVTDKTNASTLTCTHASSSMTTSWSKASSLATTYGWTFTSHTATYPADLSGLTPAQAQAETCGSARTIDNHGLPGGHGMISYPGAQQPPTALQTNYGARCFAWARQYGSAGTTESTAGSTAPYWQHTIVVNGGACNDPTAACYTIPSTGSPHYQVPSKFIGYVNALGPNDWFTLQAYILVTGVSPSYTTSPVRWDCTATNVQLHWTNDNERYCYQDWQKIVKAIHANTAIKVTDPLSVGIAFGRPATY